MELHGCSAKCVKVISRQFLRCGGWEGAGSHSVVNLVNAVGATWAKADSDNLFFFMFILLGIVLAREMLFPCGFASLFRLVDSHTFFNPSASSKKAVSDMSFFQSKAKRLFDELAPNFDSDKSKMIESLTLDPEFLLKDMRVVGDPCPELESFLTAGPEERKGILGTMERMAGGQGDKIGCSL